MKLTGIIPGPSAPTCGPGSWPRVGNLQKWGTSSTIIRKGVRYGLNPNSEASRLVNGRELTSADVVFSLRWLMDAAKSYVHTAYPGMCAGRAYRSG